MKGGLILPGLRPQTYTGREASVKINFQGDSIGALMRESRGDNYYNVIIDEDSFFILRPDTLKKYYTLASDLSPGRHTVELFKRTEWDRGTGEFYGFRIGGKAKVEPKAPEKKRKIEFYGNSITAAYAVEDFSGEDSPDSTFTNNYMSYSALLARHYHANYSLHLQKWHWYKHQLVPGHHARDIRSSEPGGCLEHLGFLALPARYRGHQPDAK